MYYFQSQSVNIFNTDIIRLPTPEQLSVNGGYRYQIDYLNGSRHPVTIINRNGISVTIGPSGARVITGFIVRVSFHFNDSVNFDATRILNEVSENSPTELRLLKEAYIKGCVEKRSGYHVATMDYVIDHASTMKQGGAIYNADLDLIISFRSSTTTPPHPYSDHGQRTALITKDLDINSVESFGYKLKIVDNANLGKERWVNIASRVFRVPTTMAPNLKDGVYLTSSGIVAGAPPTVEYFTFDEADESLELYATHDDAVALGDQHARREEEMRQLEHVIKQTENEAKLKRQAQQAELESQERQLKERELEHAATIAKLNREKDEIEHARKLEEFKRKDYYEHRSYERKDTSELFKYAPLIVSGILGLALAFK